MVIEWQRATICTIVSQHSFETYRNNDGEVLLQKMEHSPAEWNRIRQQHSASSGTIPPSGKLFCYCPLSTSRLSNTINLTMYFDLLLLSKNPTTYHRAKRFVLCCHRHLSMPHFVSVSPRWVQLHT
jgi:hypothetical protein